MTTLKNSGFLAEWALIPRKQRYPSYHHRGYQCINDRKPHYSLNHGNPSPNLGFGVDTFGSVRRQATSRIFFPSRSGL